MEKKGQAEFALILGLIVIVALVAVYSTSFISPPTISQSAMSDEQRAVASFATDLVRDATVSTINELYRNGGYLDTDTLPLGSVTTKGFGRVAYWQMCESYVAPDLEENLKRGIKAYINSHLNDVETFAGNTAAFSKAALDIQTEVYANRISVTVNLPTVYEGASLEQPYRADVYTKFGRVADFAENFAKMEAELRMLDNHLISSLSQSSEYSSCWIPFGIGNANMPHTITWMELKNCMEDHIRYSLSNTQIGREIPLTEDDNIASFHYGGWEGTGREFFFVPGINIYDPVTGQITGSDRFSDLEISFYFGDDDGLDNTEFSAPEMLEISELNGEFTNYFYGLMKVLQYAQSYSVKYPVVVNVWDESTRSSLQFAAYVYMEDNVVGKGCTSPPTLPEPTYGGDGSRTGQRCQSAATERAMITIEYESGEPVSNVPVYYGGCNLGLTDAAGKIHASIAPEMFAGLTVEADGNYFTECYGYQDMELVTMKIPKSRLITFIFKKVPITKDLATNTYSVQTPVNAGGSDFITAEISRYANICDAGTVVAMNLADDGAKTGSKMLKMPLGEYSGTIITRDGSAITGMVSVDAFNPSGSTVYVYAPSLEGFGTETDMGTESENIKSLFESCGIKVLSDNFQTVGSCQWSVI